MPKPGGKLVPARIAADTLGLCTETIRRWIRDKRIGGVRQARRWYVFRDDLNRLTASQNTIDP